MRILLVLPLFLLAAGCATPSAPDVQSADAKQPPKVVCVRETRVGSNIPVTTCSEPMTAEERQRMNEEWERAARAKPTQK